MRVEFGALSPDVGTIPRATNGFAEFAFGLGPLVTIDENPAVFDGSPFKKFSSLSIT